jgi:flavin reductase (DIM6/NTAB) family NADH-FMN oxidoreductase RutF
VGLASRFSCEKIASMSMSPEDFRKTLAKFASGVTVVTSTDSAGRIFGITVSAFCSVSLEPPLVMVSIEKGTGTHNALGESGLFNVHVLAEGQEEVSNRFAAKSEDKYEGFEFGRDERGVPVIGESLATIKCTKFSEAEGGDHTIFIGEVLDSDLNDGFPLLYWQSGYRKLEK